jgi:hypothetical protein
MTEMEKLAALLKESNLPFEVIEFEIGGEKTPQICAPDAEHHHIDAVCHKYSYGHERGLLEVMAHGPYYAEITDYDVVGYLTATEAFELFNQWWKIYVDRELATNPNGGKH